MKPRVLTLSLLLSLFAVSIASAQEEPTEGYVTSLRSIYEAPDANSNTVGFIRPGEFVRLEHVHSLVYKVFRKDETSAAGYVVYPKISAEQNSAPATPTEVVESQTRGSSASTGTIRRTSGNSNDISVGTVTDYSTAIRAASYGSLRWVHRFSNIRSGTGTDTDIVAQLPPGTPVKIGATIGNWANVFRADEDVLDPERALGFVHTSLLKEAPPEERAKIVSAPIVSSTDETRSDKAASDEDTARLADVSILQALSSDPVTVEEEGHEHAEGDVVEHIVYVTKTGTKYHLESCRHLRKSKRSMTLQEAKDKRYEACKTCKPDKKFAEAN